MNVSNGKSEDRRGMTIYLLRHAKSAWDDAGLDDHDRPLAPRGLRAGRAMASYVGERAIAPELVLCSTAARARATLDLVSEGFAGMPEVKYDRAIYEAAADDLLATLVGVDPPRRSVMLVGHQPAIGSLARLLAGDDERLAGKFPTGALAVMEVPRGAAPAPGAGELIDLVKPRELERGRP